MLQVSHEVEYIDLSLGTIVNALSQTALSFTMTQIPSAERHHGGDHSSYPGVPVDHFGLSYHTLSNASSFTVSRNSISSATATRLPKGEVGELLEFIIPERMFRKHEKKTIFEHSSNFKIIKRQFLIEVQNNKRQ
jgi:hypothetical protein